MLTLTNGYAFVSGRIRPVSGLSWTALLAVCVRRAYCLTTDQRGCRAVSAV